jgi:hypothetical protein
LFLSFWEKGENKIFKTFTCEDIIWRKIKMLIELIFIANIQWVKRLSGKSVPTWEILDEIIHKNVKIYKMIFILYVNPMKINKVNNFFWKMRIFIEYELAWANEETPMLNERWNCVKLSLSSYLELYIYHIDLYLGKIFNVNERMKCCLNKWKYEIWFPRTSIKD